MLGTPPPGYNTNSVNNQQTSPYNTPGIQGLTAQGYLNPLNSFSSSYAVPSSYAPPSSYPIQNYQYQQNPGVPDMARALMQHKGI